MFFRFGAVLVFVVTLVAAWILGGWVGYRQVEQESLVESFRYRQLVANELNRYLPIPELMAQHPLLAAALSAPDDAGVILRANEEMQRMAIIVGSSDVYLMDVSGLTIAANNYQQAGSFVGRNFGFRPYFYEAIEQDDSAIYFALGSTSRVRGLYFSHPVSNGRGQVLGVIAVKVLVHDLESQWARPASRREAEMVVLDAAGVSFLASRPRWLFRDFTGSDTPPPGAASRRRYPERGLEPVQLDYLDKPWGLSGQSGILRIRENGGGHEYLSVRTPLPRMDWALQVMVSTQSVVWTRLGFLLGGLAFYLSVLLTWLYLRERTSDLERSNQQLLDEIEQRERAQTELRDTQQELIQAAKLAVLGQMSAKRPQAYTSQAPTRRGAARRCAWGCP